MEETYLDIIREELIGEIVIHIHNFSDLSNLIDSSNSPGIIEKYIKRFVREIIIPKNITIDVLNILEHVGISKKFDNFKIYLVAYPGISYVFNDQKYSVLGIENLTGG